MLHDPAAAFGVWLVDKPAGPTSHDVVAGIRRRLGRGVKVGHAGTLDPFATGLLVVVVGRATRLVPYLTGLDKTYIARIRLGATSASGDTEGPITMTGAPVPERAQIDAAVARLGGTQRQRVPALAAVKVDGQALYARTRRGETVDLPEREITIHGARIVDADPTDATIDVEVECSKGTYIRQVATDLGETLGCGGYCIALRRTAVGRLRIEDAVAPEAVGASGGIDPRVALADTLGLRDLTAAETIDVSHGRAVAGVAGGPVMLVADDRLVAIAVPGDDGMLRPKVVLA
jgi:tRNA pseudouridine55 synthase